MRRPLRVLSGVLLATMLAACGGGPTIETRIETPATASAPSPASQSWQLVWFSDSGAWGVASSWARRIEAVKGVHVEVFDYIGYGGAGSSASDVLARVTTDRTVRAQIAGAEVIVVYGSNYDVPLDFQRACMSMAFTKRPAPLTEQALGPFRGKLMAIYEQVFALRHGKPTIVRAIDLYAPMVASWRKAGVYRACNAGWAASARVQREVAAAYGVPIASLYDAFNGPRHDLDPIERGLIGPDGGHTSVKGKALVLRTLDALGYEPVRR